MLCFVKKLTVIGIIGKTHGVNKAANPDRNAIKKIDQSPLFESDFGAISSVFSGEASITLLVPRLGVKVSCFSVSKEEGTATVSIFTPSVNAASVFAGIAKVNFFSKLIQTSLQTW